jgi:hypothetical protein
MKHHKSSIRFFFIMILFAIIKLKLANWNVLRIKKPSCNNLFLQKKKVVTIYFFKEPSSDH